MKPVTIKDLQAIVDSLNRMTQSPMAPYLCTGGRSVAQIGNYHLSQAYGGVALLRMVNDAGGVRDVLMSWHVPRRELQTAMFAYIRGMEDSQK